MNILFWSGSYISIPFLELIKNFDKIKIVSTITFNDKPQGRGLKITPSIIKKKSEELKINCITTDKIDDPKFIEIVKSLSPDLSVVISYGKIIPAEIISIHKIGMLNIHFSLLPKYRGAAPIQWCLINGDSKTGVTIFWINENIDCGDIFLQKEIEVSLNDNYYTLSDKLISIGKILLKEAIFNILENRIFKIPQVGEVSYAPLITKDLARINWKHHASKIHNLVRALVHWPKAYTFLNINEKITKLKIIETSLLDINTYKLQPNNFVEGEIVSINNKDIIVLCGENSLIKILKLQPENKKIISVKDFICGYKISQHNKFF